MSASDLWSAATRLFVPLACCALAACGSGDGFQGSGGAVGPLAPNFDSIQANIFEPLCEHCHSGANAPVGLRLDAANSYALLVGVASVERPNMLRVAAGDPNNSYLIQKLEGTAGVGERMPAGLPAVPQADINIIRQWIADGAQPSSSAAGPDPSDVAVADAELDGARAAGLDHRRLQPRAQRALRHDGDVHAATRGTDGQLGTADDVAVTPASVTVPAGELALGRHEFDGRDVGVRPLPHHARRHGARVDPRLGRQRARRRADTPAAVGRRHRRRQLHRDVHGRRHVADADVDPDERVHAALRGLSHGRRRQHCPAP